MCLNLGQPLFLDVQTRGKNTSRTLSEERAAWFTTTFSPGVPTQTNDSYKVFAPISFCECCLTKTGPNQKPGLCARLSWNIVPHSFLMLLWNHECEHFALIQRRTGLRVRQGFDGRGRDRRHNWGHRQTHDPGRQRGDVCCRIRQCHERCREIQPGHIRKMIPWPRFKRIHP